jgi:uncharacterized protein YodC (DUF2158 family)
MKNGLIVWLKSGSPAMTIREFNSLNDYWICDWFINGELKTAQFSAEQLTTEEPEND